MAPEHLQGGRTTQIGRDLPGAYFAEAGQAFTQASGLVSNVEDYFFAIAGVRFRLRFAGQGLAAKITRTLSHLTIGEISDPDFTICCWDDKAARASLPRPTDWMLGQGTKTCLRSLTNERFYTFYVPAVRILSCLDLETRMGYSCYFDASRLSMYEVSGPLRPLLNAALNRNGMQIIHASAIGDRRGSLVFAGPPFSGKSTLAIQCLMDGLSYQSDDLCVLTSDEHPRSLSLYHIAKLRDDSLPRFATLAPFISSFQEDQEKKSYFYVQEQFPERILREAPIRAIVLPQVTDEPFSRLEPASRGDAVKSLISWTLMEIPTANKTGDGIMFQAIARLPIWHLFLGRDEAHTLKLVRGLLAA